MNMDDEQIANEVVWIRDEGKWPRWPVLPVKNPSRYNKTRHDHGIMIAGNHTTVFFINMWALKTGPLVDQIKDVDKQEYNSLEELVADGWMGD